MISTGVTRRLDALGRVVIPRTILKNMQITPSSQMEFFIEKDKIIIKKYVSRDACHVTGEVSDDNIKLCDGRLTISQDVAKKIKKQLEDQQK